MQQPPNGRTLPEHRQPACACPACPHLQAHVESQPLPQVVPKFFVGARRGADARGGALWQQEAAEGASMSATLHGGVGCFSLHASVSRLPLHASWLASALQHEVRPAMPAPLAQSRQSRLTHQNSPSLHTSQERRHSWYP